MILNCFPIMKQLYLFYLYTCHIKTQVKWLDLLVAMQIWPSDQNTHRIYTCIFDLIIKGYLFFAGMFCMRYRNYVLILIVNLNNSLQAVFFLLELVDVIKEPYWCILETLRSIWINDKCSRPRALAVFKI